MAEINFCSWPWLGTDQNPSLSAGQRRYLLEETLPPHSSSPPVTLSSSQSKYHHSPNHPSTWSKNGNWALLDSLLLLVRPIPLVSWSEPSPASDWSSPGMENYDLSQRKGSFQDLDEEEKRSLFLRKTSNVGLAGLKRLRRPKSGLAAFSELSLSRSSFRLEQDDDRWGMQIQTRRVGCSLWDSRQKRKLCALSFVFSKTLEDFIHLTHCTAQGEKYLSWGEKGSFQGEKERAEMKNKVSVFPIPSSWFIYTLTIAPSKYDEKQLFLIEPKLFTKGNLFGSKSSHPIHLMSFHFIPS